MLFSSSGATYSGFAPESRTTFVHFGISLFRNAANSAGVPKFEAVTWHGVVVPAATPRPLVLKINAEINQVLALADVREKLAVQGIEAQGGTPAEFAAFLKSEIPKWTKVVRDSGAKPE